MKNDAYYIVRNGKIIGYQGDTPYFIMPGIEPEPALPTLLHNADRVVQDGEYSFLYWETVGSGGYLTVQDKNITVNYLIVAGGAGGTGAGATAGVSGGGGAGGMRTSVRTLTPNLYPITVGKGGNRGDAGRGANGDDSTFIGLTAVGGGRGGGRNSNQPASDGGSGGGGNQHSNGGTGLLGQGYRGGLMNSWGSAGGGAGGVGGVGTSTTKANGGIGRTWLDGNEYSRGGDCSSSQVVKVFPQFGWGGDGVHSNNTNRQGTAGYQGIVAIRVKTSDVVITINITYNGITYTSLDSGLTFDKYLSVTNANIEATINSICNSLGWETNLNWIDTSNVTIMSGLFTNTDIGNYDNTLFNGRIDGWDVSNVNQMDEMFRDSSFNGRIDGWDVSAVTNMQSMFLRNYIFNQDIGGWNVSSVTNMANMLLNATSFNQDISSWDVSKVTNMTNMFRDATSFNQDLSPWCVQNISTIPTNFNTGATAWTLPKPNWGQPC